MCVSASTKIIILWCNARVFLLVPYNLNSWIRKKLDILHVTRNSIQNIRYKDNSRVCVRFYKFAREDTVVNSQENLKVGKTHIYKCRTLKIKLELKFHFDMVVKEVDTHI
jgi:hypothetical protein